jgi:DMSO/TMAO reductase YedYZ molybdopterin-dependent catalytic subunit
MTVKLLLLKSGEDIIADVKEMVTGTEEDPKVIGYFLNKPCVVRMKDYTPIQDDETTEEKQKQAYQIKFYPWIPLAKEPVIPLTTEWVVTMVDPIDKLLNLYVEEILEYGQPDQSNSTSEQSDSDQ